MVPDIKISGAEKEHQKTNAHVAEVSGKVSHKRWTVAIYMVADGRSGSRDLDQVAIRELATIVEAAGPHIKDVNVAVQLDLHGVNGTLRMMVQGDNKAHGQFLNERNAASPDTLHEFFKFVTDQSKSEHYLLLFWGHSSGPVVFVGDFDVPKQNEHPNGNTGVIPQSKGIGAGALSGVLKRFANAIKEDCGCFREARQSYRRHTNSRLQTNNQERGEDRPVDIVLFKECFMSTLETAFELDQVRYMIASQGKVPRLGWPYKEIFGSLGENSARAADQILDALGKHYEVARNRLGKDEVPVALVDVPLLVQLAGDSVPSLVMELRRAKSADVESAFDRSALGDPALLDLKVLCRNLQRIDGDSSKRLHKTASDLLKIFDGAADGNGGKNRPAVRLARPNSAFGGISLFYFPHPLDALGPVHVGGSFIAPVVARHRERYDSLKFGEVTKWGSIALERLGGWNANILESFKNDDKNDKQFKTLDFKKLEDLSKASALGDVFRRPDDLDFPKEFDFRKEFDFPKEFDFSKEFDFAKMFDLVNSLDLAKVFDS
jgi:hypothetical protein